MSRLSRLFQSYIIQNPHVLASGIDPQPETINQVNLTELIDEYQQAEGTAHAAGLYQSAFAHTDAAVPNANQWLTVMDTYSLNRVRQDGIITKVTFRIYQKAGTGGKLKFKAYRKNGAVYNFVGESEEIVITATGDHTVTLSQPITVQQGDTVGCALYRDGVNYVSLDAASRAGGLVKYVFNEDVKTDNAWSNGINWSLDMEYFCARPALAITGDSIGEGLNDWLAMYNGEAQAYTGTKAAQVGAQLVALQTNLQYQNHCYQGQKWDWVRSTGIVSALTTNPKWVIAQCGTNEIFGVRTWEQISADMDAIKAACDAANATLLIAEVPPITGSSDAVALKIRQLNANYATWCASNSVKLIVQHDALGKIRVSTGQYDDWADGYSTDNTHPTTAGRAAIAALWKSALLQVG